MHIVARRASSGRGVGPASHQIALYCVDWVLTAVHCVVAAHTPDVQQGLYVTQNVFLVIVGTHVDKE